MQLSVQQQLTGLLGSAFTTFNAYIEGWALYEQFQRSWLH
jgi:uncharacterized protein (DUF885 family)